MFFLPKAKKEKPGFTTSKKVKNVVATLLATLAVAISGSAVADEHGALTTMSMNTASNYLQVDQNTPLLMVQHDYRQNGPAYHYSHSSHRSHYSHSSHSSHYSHYSGRW